jgi:hypothetical protein
MKCTETRTLLSSYLDGAVTGKQMHETEEHLAGCNECHRQYALLRQTQCAVSALGRKPAPPNLALQLRVALSHQIAKSRRNSWEGLRMRWENALNAFMVPATAGVLSAIVIFGVLMGCFALPQPLQASDSDVPTSLYTAPEVRFSPLDVGMGSINADSVVVEAEIDTSGRVAGYKIISVPEDKNTQDFLPQLKNMLMLTVFRPATAFGRPTTGKTVLSFSKINVRG